jgi:hypothetical protein
MSISRRASRSRVGAAAVAAGLAAATLLPLAAAPAVAVTTCDGTAGNDDFYNGPSASQVYDDTFSAGPPIPGLPDYVPQGLVAWPNWDGNGTTILLLGAYREGHRSKIFGINPGTGRLIGDFYVAEAHLGGLAVANGWLFGQHKQGNADGEVRKYRLSDVRKKLLASGTPYLAMSGTTQNVYSAEFMTSYNGYVWSGHYRSGGSDKMYQYKVSSSGRLTALGSSWKVPPKTQGVLVTGNRFVFSSSEGTGGAGKLWVVAKSRNYQTAAGRCFRSPSMSEGIAAVGGSAYLAFEGASGKYDQDARNEISRLHKAPLSELLDLS